MKPKILVVMAAAALVAAVLIPTGLAGLSNGGGNLAGQKRGAIWCGPAYTTISNVNPNYGTKTDGVWTQSNPLVKFNANTDIPAPSGTITQIAVVYDYLLAPGTVHVHDLTVDGQVLAFK